MKVTVINDNTDYSFGAYLARIDAKKGGKNNGSGPNFPTKGKGDYTLRNQIFRRAKRGKEV